MSKKKIMKLKPKNPPVVTKKPDGTTGQRVIHQQVNFGNVERTKLEAIGNINNNLYQYGTEMIAEQKKANKLIEKTNELLTKLVQNIFIEN